MANLKRPIGILCAGAVTAAAVVMAAAPAFAAAKVTWSVSPGGSVSGKAGTTVLDEYKQNQKLTCASSSASATLKSGTGLSGTGIGSITALSFASCTGPLGLTFTVTANHLPWAINLTSYNATTKTSTGTITGIDATLSGPDCSATIDGTSATANNGFVKVTYSSKTGALTVVPSKNQPKAEDLTIYKVSGCASLLKQGAHSTFSGKYALTPKQTITG